MATPLRIDFVSDIACPWCVIGLRSLMRALETVGDHVEADIHFQPFELNPDMPPEGQNAAEHVRQKYGSTTERSSEVRQAIKDHGAALGFEVFEDALDQSAVVVRSVVRLGVEPLHDETHEHSLQPGDGRAESLS